MHLLEIVCGLLVCLGLPSLATLLWLEATG